jgi:hypothetical protein
VLMSWTHLCRTASMRQNDVRVGRDHSTQQQASPMSQQPRLLEIARERAFFLWVVGYLSLAGHAIG